MFTAMITAIIPVKTQSERLQAKNLRYFIDCSLYEHKLRQLKKVPFDRIVVSSESKQVLEMANSYGYQGHYRNPKYSTPDVPMSDVYKYIASEVIGKDIAWINVNNPLVTGDMYTKAMITWINVCHRYDSLLSAYNIQKYIWRGGKPLNFTPYPHPKSQDLEGTYAQSFAINIRRRKDLIKEGTFASKRPFFYLLDKYVSTKIDYKQDLAFCKMLWKEKY